MKHDVTRALYAHWDSLRGSRSAPERSAIDPTALREALPYVFILEVDEGSRFPFRLAGSRVRALFGRDLGEADYASLFEGGAGMDLRGAALPRLVCDDMTPLVAGLSARTQSGRELALELLLLPLRHQGRTHARVLGSLSPGAAPVFYGLDPIVSLALTGVRMVRPQDAEAQGLRRVGSPQRADAVRHRHLFVYEGGRAAAPAFSG